MAGSSLEVEVEGEDCNPPPSSSLEEWRTISYGFPIIVTLVLLLLMCALYIRRHRITRINSLMRAHFLTRGILTIKPLDQGLSLSFRKGLPVILFDEKFITSTDNTLCPVCLGDYELNEKLQQLPTCGHAFHVECIDEWLSRKNTCPICRISILGEEESGAPLPFRTSNGHMGNGRWDNMILSVYEQDDSSSARSGPQRGEESNDHVINIQRS